MFYTRINVNKGVNMKFTTKLAAAAAALTLTTSAFALNTKLIDAKKIPYLAEVIQVKDAAIDMYFNECFLPGDGATPTEPMFRSMTMTLPQKSATNPSGFSFLKNVKCIDEEDLVTIDGDNIGSVGAQAKSSPCIEFEYNASIGHLSSVKLYLCPIGASGTLILTDSTDGGEDANMIFENVGVVWDMCLALGGTAALGDDKFLALGTDAADAEPGDDSTRNIETVLGFEYCGSAN